MELGDYTKKICKSSCLNHDIQGITKHYLKCLPVCGYLEWCDKNAITTQGSAGSSSQGSQAKTSKKYTEKQDPPDFIKIANFAKNMANTVITFDDFSMSLEKYICGNEPPTGFKENVKFTCIYVDLQWCTLYLSKTVA